MSYSLPVAEALRISTMQLPSSATGDGRYVNGKVLLSSTNVGERCALKEEHL